MRSKMLIVIVGILALSGLLTLAGCGDGEESTTSLAPTTSQGATTTAPGNGSGEVDSAQLFALNCATCHGPRGEGGTGADLRPLNEGQSDLIEEQIRNGGNGMPAFDGVLSDEQIDALIRYVAGL